MIFVITAIAVGLALWLGLRRPAQVASLSDRVAEVASPISICVAAVCVVFSALSLSLPLVNRDLSHETIGQLRSIEQLIPTWAAQVSQALPKWYVNAALAVVSIGIAVYKTQAAPHQLAGLSRQQRLIARLRRIGNVATGVSCGLCVASATTFFGDGLNDLKNEIRSQIHSAELRFQAGTDEMVRMLADEIVHQSLERLRQPQPSQRPSWSATASTIRQLRSGLLYQRAIIQDSSVRLGSPRVVLAALTQLEELRSIESNVKAAELAEAISGGATQQAGPERLWSEMPMREAMSPNSIRKVDPRNDVSSESRVERRELIKELIASVADRVKEASSGDPLIVLFSEAVAPMVTEVLASFASKAALEPLIRRLWAAGDHDQAKEVLQQEVKAMVAAADAPQHWSRLHSSGTAKQVETLAGTAFVLSAQWGDAVGWMPNEEDVYRIVDLMRSLGHIDQIDQLDRAMQDEDVELFFRTIANALSAGAESATSKGLLAREQFKPEEARRGADYPREPTTPPEVKFRTPPIGTLGNTMPNRIPRMPRGARGR